MRTVELELPQYFYLLRENSLVCYWLLFPSLVSLLSGGTVLPQNTYFDLLNVEGQVWENQKRMNMNISFN